MKSAEAVVEAVQVNQPVQQAVHPAVRPSLQPRPALTLVNPQRLNALEQSECFLGVSPNVVALKEFISVQASQQQPVLLIGERGLRQEQLARALHQASANWAQPFLAVNAHGLSDEALHTLLFGTRGMIESNPQGTIYVNELTSLPPLLQQRFAAHLEEQRWRAHSGRSQGPRLMFATEYDPTGMRAENRIAYGLVELLKPYSFTVKPLRERSEDIVYVARHLVERLTRKLGKGAHEIAPTGLRVLMAEDDGLNAAMLRTVLEQLGHRVVHAQNGKRALELARICEFDVIMLASRMPEMDGPETTAAIRALGDGSRDTAIVAVIGGDAEEARECLDAGADTVMRKPVTVSGVARAMAESVGRKRADTPGRPAFKAVNG